MRKIRIAMFDCKQYDIDSFSNINEKFEFNIKYLAPRLNIDTVIMAQGCDAICVFVNDAIDKDVIDKLLEMKIELVALRSADPI